MPENLCYLDPCRNGANCSGDAPNTYHCDCLDRWSGVNCTECDSGNILSGSRCGNNIHIYTVY